jgi:lipooligosaccharide transport system permease protein
VSMGEPLFYLITLGIGMGAYMGLFGGKPYLNFLAPGLVITSVMLSSAFECLYGSYVRMVIEKLYDMIISTPISAEDAVTGDIIWGVFRGMLAGLLMLIVAYLLGALPLSVGILVPLLFLMMITGFLFASLSMIVTSFAPNFDFFNYYTELVITPMFFFSGVFFPMDKLPGFVKVIANFVPLTHAVTISRAIFSGNYTPSLIWNLLAIVIPGMIFFYLALFFMKRRLIK